MTKLMYLDNPEMLEARALVRGVLTTEKGIALILNQTIFYVQGGGQPGDKGLIKNDKGEYRIVKTLRNDEGEVLHIVGEMFGDIQAGEEVKLIVDAESRLKNSLNHSAGHLIDMAVERVGLDWKPSKGYHFPDGSYVEFEVEQNPEIDEPLIQKVQQEFDKLVDEALELEIKVDPTQQIHGLPLRIVSFEGQSSGPCGGTHAHNTSELAGFKISKMKWKNGVVKVSYGLVSKLYIHSL